MKIAIQLNIRHISENNEYSFYLDYIKLVVFVGNNG